MEDMTAILRWRNLSSNISEKSSSLLQLWGHLLCSSESGPEVYYILSRRLPFRVNEGWRIIMCSLAIEKAKGYRYGQYVFESVLRPLQGFERPSQAALAGAVKILSVKPEDLASPCTK